MPTRYEKGRIALLQGTLGLLMLHALLHGRQHGQGISRAIQTLSEGELLVDHGSLYPALQRLEAQGWIKAEWGISNNNRKARFLSADQSRPQAIGPRNLAVATTGGSDRSHSRTG